MNERIKQLAIQADIKFLEFHGKEYCEAWVEQQEKFAELIIQECCKICDGVQEKYGQYTFTARVCKEEIKEHFGVE